MKYKLFYLLFIPYLLSFILLVFHYSQSNHMLTNSIMMAQKELNVSNLSINIMITFISILFSILTFLIYYGTLKISLSKVNKAPIDEEYLSVSILISETCCHVVALSLVGFLEVEILRFIIPLIGLVVMGTILYKRYSLKLVSTAVAIRCLFYISNMFAVMLGLVG